MSDEPSKASRGLLSLFQRSAMVRVTFALLFSILFSPSLCVVSWLNGYGPGGMRELSAGYPLLGIAKTSLILGLLHLSLLIPTMSVTHRCIGFVVLISANCLAAFFWFGLAAAIASV